MLESLGVGVSQIAEEVGIGATVLVRWRRELHQESVQAFVGQGQLPDENLALLRRELTRVTKERDFVREAAACFATASK
jgi:transposase